MIKILYITFFVFALCGCGTDTGNPATDPTNNASEPPALSESMTTAICQKINSCGWSPTNCQNSIYEQQNVAAVIGSTFSDIKSLKDIYIEIAQGEASRIQFNNSNQTSCLSYIENLSCTDSALTSAYDSSRIDNFETIEMIFSINVNCQTIIEAK